MNSTFYEDIMKLMNEGKSSEDIARMMTEALNKVQEEHDAKKQAEALKAKKIAYMKRFADLVNEYFETFEPGLLDGIEITEDECAEMLESLEELAKLVRNVKTITISDPKAEFVKGDGGASTVHCMFDDVWKEINNLKDKNKPNPGFKPPVHKPKTDDEVIREFLNSILK